MIDEGEDAPSFELPGVRDGEIEQVALSEYLDNNVVILAFYPGDFNPACSDGTTDLDELDLFTMQKDVSILGLSADSVYSHRKFAEAYNLHIPLLSDAHGRVAEQYGVAVDDENAGHLTRRAVIVIDHRGTVEYTWVASDIEELPDVDAIREAIQNVGDDDSALARYRVGHAHYIEGRRAFTSAMQAFEQKEWMMANGDFDTAYEEFSKAEDEFNTAVRFAQDQQAQTYFERAERKAESLWRASEWLGDSASAFASGEGGKAESMRKDAESPLETARDIPDPPSPDNFPPEEDPAQREDDSSLTETPDIQLDTSEEEPETETQEETSESETEIDFSRGPTAEDETTAPEESDDPDTEQTAAGAGTPTDKQESDKEEDEIDEAELEEITAELEEQTEAAMNEKQEGETDSVVPDSIEVSEEESQPPESEEETDEDIELDLTDPMEDKDEEDEEDEEIDSGSLGGGGDHGVPDSL